MELICCGKPVAKPKHGLSVCPVCKTAYDIESIKPKPKGKVDVDLKIKFWSLVVALLVLASCNLFFNFLGKLWSG